MFVWMFWCVVSQHAQHQQLRTNAGRDRNDTPTQLTRNFALRPKRFFCGPKTRPICVPKRGPENISVAQKVLFLTRVSSAIFWALFGPRFGPHFGDHFGSHFGPHVGPHFGPHFGRQAPMSPEMSYLLATKDVK